MPDPRSGTGLVAVGGLLVSVGGEGPDLATIGSVFAYDLATRRSQQVLECAHVGAPIADGLDRVGRRRGGDVAGNREQEDQRSEERKQARGKAARGFSHPAG